MIAMIRNVSYRRVALLPPVRGLLVFIALLSAACAPEVGDEGEPGSPWVGTTRTEGRVTTVVNESGSIWGGRATLVETASIGAADGPAEFLLGRVRGVYVADAKVFVFDPSVSAVRVYDLQGRHLFDFGRSGLGPGEFRQPTAITQGPAGRILVRDGVAARVSLFDVDGNYEDTWPLTRGLAVARRMLVTSEGHVYTPGIVSGSTRETRLLGMLRIGPSGPTGEHRSAPEDGVDPPKVSDAGYYVPFWPKGSWSMAPSGAMVASIGDEYRFEIRHPDGSVTVVRRSIDSVPVQAAEAQWHRRVALASLRELSPGVVWSGPAIPSTKPFIREIHVGLDGRIWVRREGLGVQASSCNERPTPGSVRDAPCWTSPVIVDLFDGNGRFLADLELPSEFSLNTASVFIRGDLVVFPLEDAAGTIRVKLYELKRPG